MMRIIKVGVVLAGAVLLAGCGGGSDAATSDGSATRSAEVAQPSAAATPEVRVTAMGVGPSQSGAGPVSDAICNDLGPNGLSIFQLKASSPKTTEMSGEEFAGMLYGHIATGCPELLKDEGVRGFLTSWGINPDA